MASKIQQLIDRRTKAEEELSAVKAEIAEMAGEVDETLDPDPAKAAPKKATAAAKKE